VAVSLLHEKNRLIISTPSAAFCVASVINAIRGGFLRYLAYGLQKYGNGLLCIRKVGLSGKRIQGLAI